jgi:hypothetical protein
VQHAENLERLTSGRVYDEVREHFVKENVLAGEVGAPVPTIWDVSQIVEASEQFADDAVCNLNALLVLEIKPKGVDVKNGIIG